MSQVLLCTENGHFFAREGGGALIFDNSPPSPENYSSHLNANTNAFSFQSVSSARDVEVSFTQNYTGRIFMRVSGGVAIMFDFAPGSSFLVKLVSGLSESAFDPTTAKTLHDQGGGLTSGHTIIFGVSGFDIYVKDNGTEILRFQCPWVCQSGTVATKEANGVTRSAGTVTFPTNAQLYSTPGTYTYDPRDFGMKSVATAGTISGSSTSLVVADATNLAIGDYIIVEIGTESGAAARGTKGVGGTWPALSYANATAMNADNSQAANTFCWLQSTGVVYQYVSGTWGVFDTMYYYNKAVPRSLMARITNKSGTTLTLDTAATVTATNANVYLDCTRYINMLTYSVWYKFGTPAGDLTSFVPAGAKVYLPAGTYYTGGVIVMSNAKSGGIIMQGRGDSTILKSPKGVPCSSINVTDYSSCTAVSYLKQIGNARDSGFGLNWATSILPYGSGANGMTWNNAVSGNGGPTTETDAPQGEGSFAGGCQMTTCNSVTLDHITSVDVWRNAMGGSFCTDCIVSNGSMTSTDGLRAYIQWQYLFSDSTRCHITDVTVTSPTMQTGFEHFRSNGGTITRATGNNASFGSNSSGNFTYTDCTCAVTINGTNIETDFSSNNPLFNIDSNISPPDSSMVLGGTLSNCVMTQAHYANANNDIFQGININSNNPNITITNGSYTAPDWLAPGTSGNDFHSGIHSTGATTVVTGFTCVGKAKHEVTGSGFRNIDLEGGSGSSATGCTANQIYVNP